MKAERETLVLCSCSEVVRLVYGWSLSRGFKFGSFWEPNYSPELQLLDYRQLCMRYPLFSLPTLSNLVLFCPWAFSPPPVNSCMMMYFLINLLYISDKFMQDLLVPTILSSLYYFFFVFYNPHFQALIPIVFSLCLCPFLSQPPFLSLSLS